jgi:hypothetical protein
MRTLNVYGFCLFSTGVWTQGFALSRQMLYCLSHISSPFCSDFFGERYLLFVQVGLDHSLPILCCCWDDRCMVPPPAFFHWDGVLQTFYPGLAWNHNSADLNLPCSLPASQLLVQMGSWEHFFVKTVTLPISAFQIARIMGTQLLCLAFP